MKTLNTEVVVELLIVLRTDSEIEGKYNKFHGRSRTEKSLIHNVELLVIGFIEQMFLFFPYWNIWRNL